jgi:aminopeptidase N
VIYWVLPEDRDKGEILFEEFLDHIRFLEEIIGPYPFRNEKIGMVEAPYLAMEHQTVITYGDAFDDLQFGFYYVVLHELVHEWWGNLVSAADWRDFWLHEGFDGYMEALYAGERHGDAAYHEFLARIFRPALRNRHAVAPRGSQTIRQALYPDGIDTTMPGATLLSMDADVYTKGAWILHTLRYLMGDEDFFTLLRRMAYPDPGMEAVTDGRQCRLSSTEEFIALANRISGKNLDWFFELYLRQPTLPRLVSEVDDGTLQLRWEVPGGLHFPMPVEVVIGDERRRVPMPGGRASVRLAVADTPVIDPDFWILRQAMPDPDDFGTVGVPGSTGQ